MRRILKIQASLTAHWHDKGADWRGLAHTPAMRRNRFSDYSFNQTRSHNTGHGTDWRLPAKRKPIVDLGPRGGLRAAFSRGLEIHGAAKDWRALALTQPIRSLKIQVTAHWHDKGVDWRTVIT